MGLVKNIVTVSKGNVTVNDGGSSVSVDGMLDIGSVYNTVPVQFMGATLPVEVRSGNPIVSPNALCMGETVTTGWISPGAYMQYRQAAVVSSLAGTGQTFPVTFDVLLSVYDGLDYMKVGTLTVTDADNLGYCELPACKGLTVALRCTSGSGDFYLGYIAHD